MMNLYEISTKKSELELRSFDFTPKPKQLTLLQVRFKIRNTCGSIL
jgi:hypothetical protein